MAKRNIHSSLYVPIKGTTTNDSAAEGMVGEYKESVVGVTNAATTSQFGDLTSISLTAGDWDVFVNTYWDRNTATWSKLIAGISATSGNFSTGLVVGSNRADAGFASTSTAVTEVSLAVPAYRVSLSSTTTYYLKYFATYSSGTPQAYGRISARRVR